jgi:GH15 family glucan-1,4-alpha-glucosidase
MAWLALQSAVKIGEAAGLKPSLLESWKRECSEARSAVLSEGYNERVHSFTMACGDDHLDASVLVLSRIGLIAGDDPRMLSTIDAIERTLVVDDLVYRYRDVDDGLTGRDGAFLACSFWMVDALALAGRVTEARARFGRLLERGNDLGLFPEEIDPSTGAALGNFPQALTHIAVINSALTLKSVEVAKDSNPWSRSRRSNNS